MCSKYIRVGCLLVLLNRSSSQIIDSLTFPDWFLFGAASSAYQVEGAWNESGKGPSRWDDLVHNEQVVIDGTTGDVACDSYHKYKEDIAALKELGVNHYRFSISWPRLLPGGFVDDINPAGVEYYNNLIDGLLEEGIEPWVTMYHWDIPQTIYYTGGWNNEKIIEYMTYYADVLFGLYGDRVKKWLTINEPLSFCATIPTEGAKLLRTPIPLGITEYLCGHNVLKAHGKIYGLYQLKYKKIQGGRVSIVLNMDYGLPLTDTDADKAASKRKADFELGWFLHPLVYGDYPPIMIETIKNLSAIQGYPYSRLPRFTLAEKMYIKGAYDFIALNHYSSTQVYDDSGVEKTAGFYNDSGVATYENSSWVEKDHPEGFRQLLSYIKDNYQNPEIVITEQGYVDEPNTFNDTGRINYYQMYLSAALQAIYEDGVNLTAYTAWSLLDSFEWNSGYSIRLGLYHVDFDDENRPRTPKESVSFFKHVITTGCVVDSCV